jgi:hypothetical protein
MKVYRVRSAPDVYIAGCVIQKQRIAASTD